MRMKLAGVIKQEHRVVLKLVEDVLRARKPDKQLALAEALGRQLMTHMAVEEELVYPVARDLLKEQSLVLEAVEEHQITRLALLRLLDTPPEHGAFLARVRVLEALIKLHVREEERDLLPRLVRALDSRDEALLVTSMAELEEQLVAEDPLAKLEAAEDRGRPQRVERRRAVDGHRRRTRRPEA